MTGISAVCGSALSWREAPEPSISGMPRSATIRSRRSRRAEGQGGVAVGRLEGLVALAGQYLDHDTAVVRVVLGEQHALCQDRKSTRLNSSHLVISYAVFCLKKKKKNE